MYYKPFRDHHISALGMGGLRLPTIPGHPNQIDRVNAQRVIDTAIECGINYFDTAYTYQDGDSERALGEALSRYPRDSYYLATKFYAAAGKDIQAVFTEQLHRCRTDYFDFYLLHSLDEHYFSAYTDEKLGYLRYLLKQKQAGRIRYIGFSSHAAPETLSRFLDWYHGFDMALIQLNYLDWTMLRAKEQYEILTQYGVPVWVMEPLKGGRLATLNQKAAEILRAALPECPIPRWGFRFLMGLPNVQTVLSGMSTVEQVLLNTETFATPNPLSASEQAALQKASEAFMRDLGVPCSGCRYCCAACPAKLDIPLLIRGFNEHNISGEIWKVASLTDAKGPDACLQCGACRAHCPQKIGIPSVMRQLAAR